MEYGAMREVCRTGDKILVRGTGLISIGIRVVMADAYSHAAIIRWDRPGDHLDLMIDEMREFRGHRRNYASDWCGQYWGRGIEIYYLQAAHQVTEDEQRANDWLRNKEHISAKYGYATLPLVPLVCWDQEQKWTPRIVKALKIDPSRLNAVCSVFCQRFDQAMGYDELPSRLAAPGTLARDPGMVSLVQITPNRKIHQVPVV